MTDRPSIYDVADCAGVSIATVSRVLHGKGRVAAATRQRVQQCAEQLRWQPSNLARGLAGRGHGALAIVFPEVLGPYFSQVIRGFDTAAQHDERSVLLLVTHGRPDASTLVRDLAGRVDGLVIMDRTIPDEVAQEIGTRQPVVLLARPALPGVPTVRAENVESARALTRHLLDEHGFRDLGFLGVPDSAPDVAGRWEGFVAAHVDAGLTPPAKPLVVDGFNQHHGTDAAELLLSSGALPRVLVCANDEGALGVMSAAQRAGLRIPDDVAVTGWDDIPAASVVTPGLTTVRQPMQRLGEVAGQVLLDHLAGGPTTEIEHVLPTEVVVRGTCGCRPTRGAES